MAGTAIIEDSTIYSMLQDPKFADIIPCFMNKRDIFNTVRSSCGTCAKKRQEKQRGEMAKIKSCLAGMSSEKKAEFKKLLDAEKVRVIYVNAGGQVVQLTF
ncbi:hypothetical protein [Sphingorhabdus sp.]|uniref:hypothetical protein n=1 Tax=Sphingorhabdus sp. TaxID=1902408 RepID=UPI0033412A68